MKETPNRKRGCEQEGCDRIAYARAMCNLHYKRWRRGALSPGARTPMTIDEVVEEIAWLRAGGVSPELICEALHTSAEALTRRLERNGLHDVARHFYVTSRVA